MDDPKTPRADSLPSDDLSLLVAVEDESDNQPSDRENEGDEIPA